MHPQGPSISVPGTIGERRGLQPAEERRLGRAGLAAIHAMTSAIRASIFTVSLGLSNLQPRLLDRWIAFRRAARHAVAVVGQASLDHGAEERSTGRHMRTSVCGNSVTTSPRFGFRSDRCRSPRIQDQLGDGVGRREFVDQVLDVEHRRVAAEDPHRSAVAAAAAEVNADPDRSPGVHSVTPWQAPHAPGGNGAGGMPTSAQNARNDARFAAPSHTSCVTATATSRRTQCVLLASGRTIATVS